MSRQHPSWMLLVLAAFGPLLTCEARQEFGPRASSLEPSMVFGDNAPSSWQPTGSLPDSGQSPGVARPTDIGPSSRRVSLLERLGAPLDHAEDRDGRINTDRPSFTPSNATVPRGRLQVESGYTFTHDLTRTTRNDQHLFPELAVRLGLNERLELRTFWAGQTYRRTTSRPGGDLLSRNNGPTNFVAGFKWQVADQDRLVPKAALITDLAVPTSDTSPNSSDGIEPVLFLLYGWQLTDRLSLAGSTGLTTVFDRGVADAPSDDSFEQFSQSLITFFSAGEKVTLFSEWFVLARTNSSQKLPQHFMDGGLMYQPTPNLQFDLRAGLGLGDHPTDVFAGAGVSFRY